MGVLPPPFGFLVSACLLLPADADGDGLGEGATVTAGTGFLGAGVASEAVAGPVAVTAATLAATAAAVTPWAATANPCSAICCKRQRNGSCTRNDSGPVFHNRRGIEIPRNARTAAGSNWVPAHRASSARAAATAIGFL